MSLDVYLDLDEQTNTISDSGIFVRENGAVKEISREEWDTKFPNREPLIVQPQEETTRVYSANITHNLNTMAKKAGIYKHLWRPDEINIEWAYQLIEPLRLGLVKLLNDPDYYKQFNPENGWGDYNGLVTFVKDYLNACKLNPNAKVSVCR